MTDDTQRDDDLRGFDLTAWDVPPPGADLADAVVARMAEHDAVSPVTSMIAMPPRRRWWLVGGVAAGVAAIVALGTIIITGSHRDDGTHEGDVAETEPHVVVAQHAQHLALPGVTADLDPDSEVRWRRDADTIRVEQTRGLVAWKVDDAAHLIIDPGAMGASIDATGSSLRVEVHMNHADSRVIAGSAITAAVAAVVTVVVYEGRVNVRNVGQTITVAAGSTVELKPNEPAHMPNLVGAGPSRGDVSAMNIECMTEQFAKDFTAMRACARQFRKDHPDQTARADQLDRSAADGLEAKLTFVQIKTSIALGTWGEARTLADEVPIGSPYHMEIERAFAKIPCGVADLVSSARRDMDNGLHGDALVKLETTATCQPSDEVHKLALTAACSVRGEGHAGAYLATRARHESTTIDALCKTVTVVGPRTVEPPCSDELEGRGTGYVRTGDFAAALDMYERHYACSPTSDSATLAYTAACNAENAAKAREYFGLIDADRRKQSEAICAAHRISVASPPSAPPPTASKKRCDANILRDKGTEQFSRGMFAVALTTFEQALECKPSIDLVKLSYVAACNAHDATKARLHFARLPPRVQRDVSVVCVRNGIDVAGDTPEPEPACDVGELQSKGTNAFSMGQFAASFAWFKQALACKSLSPARKIDLIKLTYTAACNARNPTEAKRYFGMLSKAVQNDVQIICIRNNIQVP